MSWTWWALAACTASPGTATGTTTATTVTGTTSTTTASTSTTGTTAGLAPMEVVQEGQVACAEPELRATQPLVRIDGGPDWQAQLDLPGGTGEARTYGAGVVVADLDGDGLLDIFLPNHGPDQLYMGARDGDAWIWVDETEERWPANPNDLSEGAAAVDLDDDGDLDLVVANRGSVNHTYLNDGTGHFELNPNEQLSTEPSSTCSVTFGDLDLDGDLDAYFASHFIDALTALEKGDNVSDGDLNELVVNEGGGVLRDVTFEYFPQGTPGEPEVLDGYTFVAGLVDLDDDGDVDLYHCNDFGHKWEPNQLLRNDPEGDGRIHLTNISEQSGLDLAFSCMGLGYGDFNDDLLPDVVLAAWNEFAFMESYPGSVWINTALARGLTAATDQGSYVAWGLTVDDLDNDGDLDIPVPFGTLAPWSPAPVHLEDDPYDQPDMLFLQEPDGSFRDAAAEWGYADVRSARGIAVTDINGDGFLDVVKRFYDDPAAIYLSNCDDSAWLVIDLEQPAPNVDAVGARVVVEAGDRRWVRWLQVGGRSVSVSVQPVLHFGLGDVDVVDRIEVRWPDGAVSVAEGIPTRQRVTLRRLAGD